MSENILSNLSSLLDAQKETGSVFDLPENAPFDPQQREWLNGLIAGVTTLSSAANNSSIEQAPATPLLVYYGSQSGNCEVLAKQLKKFSATQGFKAELAELDSITPADLSAHQHVLILCSTFGEGEPPDNAKHFYQLLMAPDMPALPESLNFSVCGLGDSSYKYFNKAGNDIYNRLVALGATACHEFVACDTAFEDEFADWQTQVFNSAVFKAAAASVGSVETDVDEEPAPLYSKNVPFIANLITQETLSSAQSAKTVNHIEISLAGGGADMHYDVGDALGVWPLNCVNEVNELLSAAGFTGREVVEQKSGSASLRVLLQTKLDIHTVNAKTLECWGLSDASDGDQVIDVLTDLKPELDAQTFVDGLRPMQPRLYSIASSPKAHPGEVHLTVGEVHYQLNDKARKGVASTWLGNRLTLASNLGVYVQASKHFHLPADDSAPLIMIGPGTGIAPFRAFLEERDMRKASGKNWLFFGDQHEAYDYLYQSQIEGWQASGLLTHLSLAWSRDSDAKIYVQTLIREQGDDFFQWLEEGAYIYICGDASRMAADVDTAIREVLKACGHLDESATQAYINKLVSEHRYQRDVY